MALDSYNRMDALNAVIEAWTRSGSLPAVTQTVCHAGSSVTLQCSPLFRCLVFTYSWRTQLMSAQMGGYMNGAWTYREILNGNLLTSSRSGNTITFNNTDPNGYDVEIYIIALNGSIEEV